MSIKNFFICLILITLLSHSAKVYATNDSRPTDAEGWLQLADSQHRQGHWTSALSSLQNALNLARQQADSSQTAQAMTAMGALLMQTGRAEEGLEILLQAVEKVDPASPLAGRLWNNLGIGHMLRQQPELAKQALLRAHQMAKSHGEDELTIQTGLNLARVHYSLGQPRLARPILQDVYPRLLATPPSPSQITLMVALASLVQEKGSPGGRDDLWYNRVGEVLQQALTHAQQLNSSRMKALVLAEWGGFLEEKQESQQALSLTQQAVFHAQEAMAPDLLYETQWRSGRLLRQAGNYSAALVAYREALEQLESIRQERMVVASSRNHSYRQEVGGVYMELVDLLLSSPEGNKKETLQEVQHILELLKSAELEDYFKDDCVDTARSRQQEQPIPPKVAVLYPIMLENRTVILLGRSDGWHQIVIPVAGEEVKQKAALLRFNLEKRTSRTYLNQARTLYDWLIRPLENHLQQVETLVFVPDETLREIPLATLHDGKQHLIDAYAVVVIPGLQLLQSQSLTRPSNHILLAGLTQGVQGFSPLPHVASELKAIATLYPGRTLQDDDFSLPNLHREMEKENYQVVHIASHGQFTGNIKESFLLTHDGRITMDDLDRLVRRPQSPDQPVDLLTLSACQTAKGDDRAALGLAGVAVKAGTRGALATLWYVNDQAASLLVEEFYRHLQQPGANKAVALQSAQKSLKQNRSYAHPAYWGGFLMIGNWL